MKTDEQFEASTTIRIAEEMLEQERREKVMSGEWTEEESHYNVQKKLDDIERDFPTNKDLER